MKGTTNEWPGVIDTSALKESFVDEARKLADAAKLGNWTEVARLLDASLLLTANQWRIDGTSWFTPLHQAAWFGAPVGVVEGLIGRVGVVEGLIGRGAWRSLRNAEGERPVDVAEKRGHHHLLSALAVRDSRDSVVGSFEAWDHHLSELIAERTRGLEPVRLRNIPTEIIAFEPLESLWFAYPGMYGGFSVSLHRNRLFVESWSRVVGGSGQAHVITDGGCVLVEEGFV